MLKNWIFRAWKHNHTYTKLVPLLKLKEYPYWIFLILSPIPIYLFWYSTQGLVYEIIPNMTIVKNDVNYLISYLEIKNVIEEKII